MAVVYSPLCDTNPAAYLAYCVASYGVGIGGALRVHGSGGDAGCGSGSVNIDYDALVDVVRESGTWASELVAVGCSGGLGSFGGLGGVGAGARSSEDVAVGGFPGGCAGGGCSSASDGSGAAAASDKAGNSNGVSNAQVGQVIVRGKNYEANLRRRNRTKRLKKERMEESAASRAAFLARKEVEDKLAAAKASYKLEKFRQADLARFDRVQEAKDKALLAKYTADEVYWKARVSGGAVDRQLAVEKKLHEAKLAGSVPLVNTSRVRGWAETVKSGSTGSGSKGSSGKKTVWSGAGASEATDLSVYSARIAELEEALRKEKLRNKKNAEPDDTSLRAQLDRAKRFIKDKDDHLSRQIAAAERAESICNQLLVLYRERTNDKDFKNVVLGIQRFKNGLSKTI